ncbi:MAG: hypothetical protein KatS3mg057_2504 [Herpetosiphonaceae bacterium]|nr:MAG: hypothetical protein KatS3mg057_2504 [Herpetosiphonaceae bacterium]
MRAIVLLGHGSLRAGSGAAMIRLAARAREAGLAPIVEAGFLNYSRPSFADALARCVAKGAEQVIVQPYFLVPGKFVRIDIQRLVNISQATQPGLRLLLAPPFGDHPALAQLVLKRAAEVEGAAAGSPAPAALLVMAHGSPNPRSNAPIEGIARRIEASGRYAAVVVCYMDLNQPSIPQAIDALVAHGIQGIVAVPYFLQFGGHVAEDLPAAIDEARLRHPALTLLLAGHLAYDPLLLSVIADRVQEAA